MPSTDKVAVRLSVDISEMVAPILATQMLLIHDRLASEGFERTDERIVRHPGTGIMVAANESGYRISYYCPEARTGTGMVDLPLMAPVGEVAYLALALHWDAERDACCPELDCGEPLRLIESGAVGHCGMKCGN